MQLRRGAVIEMLSWRFNTWKQVDICIGFHMEGFVGYRVGIHTSDADDRGSSRLIYPDSSLCNALSSWDLATTSWTSGGDTRC